jgi:predicted dehydrogenase
MADTTASTSSKQSLTVAPLRWGILSTAAINEHFLAAASISRLADVVAVASRQHDRATAYAADHGIECAYGSYDELLRDEAIEAIYISLPNSLHTEWTVRALKAGKHVLCEKPFTRSASEAEYAFELAASSGMVLTEGLMYRHHPQTQMLKDIVDSGRLGELRFMRAALSFTLHASNDVRLSKALDGGALMDVGCYCVSTLRLIGGECSRVYAEAKEAPSGVDVRFASTLFFEDGVIGQFDVGLDMPKRWALEVVGSEATLVLDDPWVCDMPVITIASDRGTETLAVAAADPFLLQIEDFAAAVRSAREPLIGRDEIIGQAATLEALLESSALREVVAVARAPIHITKGS